MTAMASSGSYWNFSLIENGTDEDIRPADRTAFPVKSMRHNDGIPWAAFEHTRDGVKMEYTMRCDLQSVGLSVGSEVLSPDFRAENCIYPRALISDEEQKDKEPDYETNCNRCGWALADLNPMFRGKRDLLRRAVLVYRHAFGDLMADEPKLPPPEPKHVPQDITPMDYEAQLKLLEQQNRLRKHT